MNNRHSRSKTWTASCTAIQHFHCLYDFVPFGLSWIQAKKEGKFLPIVKRPLWFQGMWTTIFNIFLTPIINAHIFYGDTPFCIWSLNSLRCISFLAALLPTQLMLLLVVVVMLDLLNAEVLEGTELKEWGGDYTNATQSPPEWFCINSGVSHLPLIVRGKVTRRHFID